MEPFLDYIRAQSVASENCLQLAYLSAYDVLPSVVQNEPAEFWKTYFLATQPGLAWYSHLCLLLKSEFQLFEASLFRWHKGRLRSGREYMILSYPAPPEVELSAEEFAIDPSIDEKEDWLYPYFSVVLRQTTTKQSSCFALGQSPVAGRTTLRRCRASAHYSLGEGPEPKIASLLEVLDLAEERPILGATVRHEKFLDETDRDWLGQLS